MRARLAHTVLIVLGLVIFCYPLTVGANPSISCRGKAMGPGDTCSKAGDVGVQTYEQRLRTAEQAEPVLISVGLLLSGFGASLLVADLRRRKVPAPARRPG